jgi:integrase/recombinase XerD
MARRKNALTQEELLPQHKPVYAVDDIDSGIDLFLRDGRIRNISPYTTDFYRQELLTLKRILEKQGVDSAPAAITERVMKENVILYLMDAGNQETSINCVLRAARAFFNFLIRDGHLTESPMSKMTLVRQKKKAVPTFSAAQLHLITAQADAKTFVGVRDRTIMMLFAETGVRVRELIDIETTDIDWNNGLIMIAGKNGKDRPVPFQATMKAQLAKYLQLRGQLEHNSVFVTIDNTPIARRQVQDQINFYGKRAGITDVRCSPHTFRHTFAKMSIQNGADPFALQAILGHATLDQVRTYVNLFSHEVRDKHKKFSPVEKLF